MTRLLEEVIAKLQLLPEAQQNSMAEFLLHELAEDKRWARSSTDHQDKLKGLIDDDPNGRCEPLNLDRP